MKKTIYLHIGMSKTGTTSLQRTLAENTNILNKANILYPNSMRPNTLSHHQLAQHFQGKPAKTPICY